MTDSMSRDQKLTGTDDSKPILVAIKGTVFDVSRNVAYRPGGAYHGMYCTMHLRLSPTVQSTTSKLFGGGDRAQYKHGYTTPSG